MVIYKHRKGTAHTQKGRIKMTATEERIGVLFEELVPDLGKADTVAGEIIRAISRIGYRFYNDGDHIGCDYGNETCNAPARYLMELNDKRMNQILCDMWGMYNEHIYEGLLDQLEKEILVYLEAHPELATTENDVDMWSFFNKSEDEDYDRDEDDEDY